MSANASDTCQPGLAMVATLIQKPRKGTQELLEISGNLADMGLGVLVCAATSLAARRPRHPTAITVDVRGRRADIVKLMGFVELIADDAILDLYQMAIKMKEEYPRFPVTTAQILKFPKKPARKQRMATA